jgi:DNA-binding SARP family transcriptional activator
MDYAPSGNGVKVLQPLPEKMEFGLLGPLMVRSARGEVALPRGRRRSMLALLLLDAGRVVPAGKITETLWSGEPPPSAATVIRQHVWQLRQALGPAGPQRIIRQPYGYLIPVGEGELDLARFEELLAAARLAAGRRSWESAVAAAGDALTLWRGEPLADVDSDALALREVPRLAEMRLQAEELRLDAALLLGGHTEAAAELARLAAAHPLREHVHALWMLALYRCGRQADALAAYRQTRARLVAEIGSEPGAELQQVHQQILTADPALNVPQAAVAGGLSPAGSGPDGVRNVIPDVPHQLPAAVAQFAGRAAELRMLTRMLDQATGAPGTVVISAISGTAGVGKTALALHWAHQVADRFPAGQLYVNLRGFDPAGTPAAPAEVIGGFLNSLGVPPERLPPAAAAQQGLYRSLLADRQMLLVLDNAADEQQVRPLLPASPHTLVIVTSRRQLGGLAADGNTHLLSLDVLSHEEATRLARRPAGRRARRRRTGCGGRHRAALLMPAAGPGGHCRPRQQPPPPVPGCASWRAP